MRFMRLSVILLCMLMPAAMAQDETADAEVADASADTETTPEIDETAEPASPGKYQASEQISDDLSVSFPVDI
jgi:hypothetical protein